MRRGRSWTGACALLIVGAMLFRLSVRLGWLQAGALRWTSTDWRAAPWTLWTAAFASDVPARALADVLALAALAVLGRALAAPPRDGLALLLAWPLATLSLALVPAVQGYAGLSAVVHAAAAVLALRALLRPQSRTLGLLLAGGLLIKLALEKAWQAPVGFDGAWGTNVVFAAHLAGACTGAALLLALEALRPWPSEQGADRSHIES